MPDALDGARSAQGSASGVNVVTPDKSATVASLGENEGDPADCQHIPETLASIGGGRNEGDHAGCLHIPETFEKDPSERPSRSSNIITQSSSSVGHLMFEDAGIQFANKHVQTRPVLFSKALCPCYNSIGYLECGSVQATCFLISSRIILTNCHVVHDILKARTSSTHINHYDVFVYFQYEKHGEKGRCYKLMPIDDKNNIMSEELDYAFLYLQDNLTWKKTLGRCVRCKVPDLGNTCIVAHPCGLEKKEELCPILPLCENRRYLELKRRVAKRVQECVKNPAGCTVTASGKNCVHRFLKGLQDLCRNESVMTYDVGSMFEGSSGAPVFDMCVNIVALQSRGFRLEDTSVVEVGITFKAIIYDLLARGFSHFVQQNFPHCWDENMDEDMGEDMDEAMLIA